MTATRALLAALLLASCKPEPAAPPPECVGPDCSPTPPSCTPRCAEKCAGAEDGCGGTCATTSCAGCCDGTTCNPGDSASACGSGGAACASCAALSPTAVCANHACGPCTTCGPAMGTNLSGMEWARPGLRYGTSNAPNLNFTVPRKADVLYLAANGFTKNRLPIQWELLQPMLHDTVANAAARAAIGEPGEFDAVYAAYITDVLDAHAAAGIKAIVDLHNYCRYQDFKFQSDGSVLGLVKPSDPLLRAYTTDGSQVQVRICATAPGSRLTKANLVDFWKRAAAKWKDHPGFGGYGLMNEPHDLPRPGGTDESYAGDEDLTIWPSFAQAAIDAIRAIDPKNPIYVSGNGWDAAMAIGTSNPGFPLTGSNLVYEVHMYLDASSSGFAFDYDTEVAKGYSAGETSGPITVDTGLHRIKIATDWAKAHGVKLALTEVGMPIDDPRWQEMFRRAIDFARGEGVELYSWMGGNHWPIRNYAINHVPGWHQNKTLEPAVSGPMKAAAGISQATLYDDGEGYAAPGGAVSVTVYARGNLAQPVTLEVTSDAGGSFSKSTLTIPAGPNGQDTFTFTPRASSVATLTYRRAGQDAGQVPPPRKVYALADPVAYATTNATDAAMAILAKYKASKWNLADGYTDYLQGAPAGDGQPVRAVSDSGYGSSPGNAMEMLNWLNRDNATTTAWVPPSMRVAAGKKALDVRAANTVGLWCKKSAPMAGVQANPKNRAPYDLQDPHFAIAAIRLPSATNTGVVFQASMAEESCVSELRVENGRPQARWADVNGQAVALTAGAALTPGTPAVLAMTSKAGAQALRVNGAAVGTGTATFAASTFNQLLIGWGFLSYYPRDGFGGEVFAVVTGKGSPSDAELKVLERYLGTLAGASF